MRYPILLAIAVAGAALPAGARADRFSACPETLAQDYQSERRQAGSGYAALGSAPVWDYVVVLTNTGRDVIGYRALARVQRLDLILNEPNNVSLVSNVFPRTGRLQPGQSRRVVVATGPASIAPARLRGAVQVECRAIN